WDLRLVAERECADANAHLIHNDNAAGLQSLFQLCQIQVQKNELPLGLSICSPSKENQRGSALACGSQYGGKIGISRNEVRFCSLAVAKNASSSADCSPRSRTCIAS